MGYPRSDRLRTGAGVVLYRNKRTGKTIETECELFGIWEPVKAAAKEPEKPAKKKKGKAKK